jgi:hypothetical protein
LAFLLRIVSLLFDLGRTNAFAKRSLAQKSRTDVTSLTADSPVAALTSAMPPGFYIFRKLENGELLEVAWRSDIEQAERLVASLHELWPAEYLIQDATDSEESG